MAEYIEREAALKIIDNYGKTVTADAVVVVEAIKDIVGVITPAADVVEVVRCKDCKFCEDKAMSGLWCTHPDNRNPLGCRKDDYCSDGERRE